MKSPSQHGGFTLVETVIYVGLLALMCTMVIQAVVGMSRVQSTLRSAKDINTSAQTVMERMIREIRQAESVQSGVFNTALNAQLILNTTDSSTIEFYRSGATIRSRRGGVDEGPLTTGSTTVSNLIFRSFTNATTSSAIKIELTLESGTGTAYRVENFYGTAVLRGSYQN